MPEHPVHFSAPELDLMHDAELMRARRSILSKIQELLAAVQHGLESASMWEDLPFAAEAKTAGAKISKGDNYLGMPYLVLDYPRCYGTREVFAYRVMFWWGHEFSAFLHLKGQSLNLLGTKLQTRWTRLQQSGFLVSSSDNEWVQHAAPEHYAEASLLSGPEVLSLKDRSFLKMGRTLPLEKWASLEEFSLETLELLLGKDM